MEIMSKFHTSLLTSIAVLGVLGVATLASSLPAFAVEGPTLPSSAKKLTKDQIIAFMDGKTFKYKSYNHEKLTMGLTTFDFKGKKVSGTYSDKGIMKKYSGQPLSMNGDVYCYDKSCPSDAGSVYLDGSTIYEVKGDGKVGEVLTK